MDGTPLVDVLTARQVAAQLGCTTQTIYDMVRRGELPCTRITASRRPPMRFLARDVAALLDRANGIERAEARQMGVERR